MNRIIALLAAASLTAVGTLAAADTVFITGARLLDVEAGRFIDAPIIHVQDGRVVSVASGSQPPENVRVIDLSGKTLLPGLIDMHVHLDGRPEYGGYSHLQFTDRFWTALAVANAEKMLRAGFTTVRNVGDGDYNVRGVDQAIEAGWIPGPRIVNGNHALGATGGHCDETFLPPSFNRKSPGVADSPEEFRVRVREQRKYGAEVIKVCATGGVFSRNTEPGQAQLHEEELRAIAEEAHFWGLKVAAHAHGAEGIKHAIRAGIDTIEHASLIDDEGISLAKERGTYLAMDIFNTEYTQSEGRKNGVLEDNLRKDREIAQIQRDNFRKAHAAGVKLVFATDAGVMPHEIAAGQFRIMTEYGMSPLEAIRSATIVAAAALGQEGQVGTLRPGAHADLIAVDGDPLTDITVLESVSAVVKGGQLATGVGAPTP
jgi:imidazolonepropionase-like amidohydrolase